MTFRITKEFHFSASHQLASLPPDHQCARLHGHNYIVEVELTADDLNEHGFVRDYQDLSVLKQLHRRGIRPSPSQRRAGP